MLVIRLQRVGKKKQASFRVVLQEKTWKPQGKAQELLGFYNPETKEKSFQAERIKHWISKGAEVSPTVHNLLVDEKVIEGPKIKAWQPKKKPSSAKAPEGQAPVVEETKEEPKAEAAPEITEAPAEPAPPETVAPE